jgi:hypothetical protein
LVGLYPIEKRNPIDYSSPHETHRVRATATTFAVGSEPSPEGFFKATAEQFDKVNRQA